MPQLLLELFAEEIPARMQRQAADDLKRLIVDGLKARGFAPGEARAFATPRRLVLVVEDLPSRQPDTREERKGPRTNAPQAALDGFLRSTGLSKEQLTVQNDPKGDFYIAVIEKKGVATDEVLPALVVETVKAFPWPKSMRWGPEGFVFVRPLRGALCLLGGKTIAIEIGDVKSGATTHGHRLMGDVAFAVTDFADYETKLRAHKVMLDTDERKRVIADAAKKTATAAGLEWIEDQGLLEEVAGLVEWPVVLMGGFEPAFLDVPNEVLISTMRANQKYFALRDPKTQKLANKFLVVANLEAQDGGKAIIAGNERVLRARLSDAKFFWDQDLKHTLSSRVDALKSIVFHAKLGTQFERVERIEALAGEIAAKIGADVAKAKRAARLAKADLTSGVVGEFPEVQGKMGRYYALYDKEDADVADALRDHYAPLGPTDAVPTRPVSVAVALADKSDILAGFFRHDEKPTGSKDPFALRRAALGINRLVLENDIRLGLVSLFKAALARHDAKGADADRVALELLAFSIDRLKVGLRDKGVRHDLIDAVFSLGGQDDLVLIVRRVEALQSFLKTEDGANLLAGYKRAANILKAEQKKNPKESYAGSPDPELLVAAEEKALYTMISAANDLIAAEIERERFDGAMGVLSKLRAAVDAFFDKVTVNADDPKLRENRLKLLSQIVATAHTVADFSKIEG